MSSINFNRKPFRIELKRQQNGKFLMSKTQLKPENFGIEDNTDFENEKDLKIAVEKWSKFYKITKNALSSLERILENNKNFINNNFQIVNDGDGGLNINIKNYLLQNIINKNENSITYDDNNDTTYSNVFCNSEDPLEFEEEMQSANEDDEIENNDGDDWEPRLKYQRQNSNSELKKDIEEQLVELPCSNLKQVSKFEIKLKRNREIRKYFCSLILKQKKSTTNMIQFLEKCLEIVFSECIFSKFNLTGDNGKIKTIDNFIINVISECTLELFPTTNLNEVHHIISNCFDNCEKKNKLAIINSILYDKIIPMMKRNKHKIDEKTLFEDLDLPCRNIKDFLILDKNCQQKEFCEKLCMIFLNQEIAMASVFVENCFKKMFTNKFKEYSNIHELIKKSFIMEILKQCTEQCFEDITMDFMFDRLKGFLNFTTNDLSNNKNSNTKYEIDIIDFDDYKYNNDDDDEDDEYDIENGEINDKKNFEFKLPCTTNDELHKFDDLCRKNKIFAQKVKNLFMEKNGYNVIKFTSECLSSIFNKALACTYNWTGSNGEKHTVHDLYLVVIILSIGKDKFPKIRKREAELAIMRWFRYAQQRYKYNKYSLDKPVTAIIPIENIDNQTNNNNSIEKYDTYTIISDVLNLPCETQEELKALNRGCETPESSKYKALKAVFVSEQTDDPRRYARKCLERVLSQTLAIEYNWTGRGVRQKIACSNFPFIHLIQHCFNQLYPLESYEQLERDCLKFFKYTNQRLSLKNTENIKDIKPTTSDTKTILTEIMKN